VCVAREALCAALHLGLPSRESRALFLTTSLVLKAREAARAKDWGALGELVLRAAQAQTEGAFDDQAAGAEMRTSWSLAACLTTSYLILLHPDQYDRLHRHLASTASFIDDGRLINCFYDHQSLI
jgi:hypothetical protein